MTIIFRWRRITISYLIFLYNVKMEEKIKQRIFLCCCLTITQSTILTRLSSLLFSSLFCFCWCLPYWSSSIASYRTFTYFLFFSSIKGKLFILLFPDKNKLYIHYTKSMFETIRRTFASSNTNQRMKSKYVLYIIIIRQENVFFLIKDQCRW